MCIQLVIFPACRRVVAVIFPCTFGKAFAATSEDAGKEVDTTAHNNESAADVQERNPNWQKLAICCQYIPPMTMP